MFVQAPIVNKNVEQFPQMAQHILVDNTGTVTVAIQMGGYLQQGPSLLSPPWHLVGSIEYRIRFS